MKSTEKYREHTEELVKFIHENDLVLLNNCGYGFVNAPVDYYQSNYPGYTFSQVISKSISGVTHYFIDYDSFDNSCAVYATAAVLKYHLEVVIHHMRRIRFG